VIVYILCFPHVYVIWYSIYSGFTRFSYFVIDFRAFSYCSSMFHLSDCVIGVSWNSVFSLASAGLAIFYCVPTTLTSGVSLTQVWCGLHWHSLQSLCMYVSIYYLLLLYIEMTCVLSMICSFPDRIGINPSENFTCGCHWQLAGANTLKTSSCFHLVSLA
jgi:hypothetical protein